VNGRACFGLLVDFRLWWRRRAACLASVLALAPACAWHAQPPSPLTALSVSVADLELHLRDDPYRSFAHLLPDGRNVFEVTRWKLERLQRARSADPAQWEDADFVIEFARARTLERLHLYSAAAEAYRRVATSSSPLATAASAGAAVMDRFAAQSGALARGEPEAQLSEIDARIAGWAERAEQESDPGYAALAREEAESWETMRVAFFARERGNDAALEACDRLIRRHRASKLYPRHLLRLGDLHVQAGRDALARARAELAPLAESAYEQHFEAALSAYELASEARSALLRREAQSRLQSLLAFHDGVRSGVY
jgi:hypothetical protein